MRQRLRQRFGYRVENRRRLIGAALRGDLPVSRARALAFALSGGVTPLFQGGGPEVTMTTTAAVLGGRLVEISGDRSIRHAASASQKVMGVAKQDASAVGDKVGVATSGVYNLLVETAVAAGDLAIVSAAGDGRIAPQAAADARAIVGIVLAAGAPAASVPVLLRKG